MKRVFSYLIILALGGGMISCSDDYAAVEKKVIENEKSDPGDGGDGDGNGGTSGGGLPPSPPSGG